MEQPIKKNKFLTLPDLAFGFVHKRSGNEITHWGVGNLIASLDFMLRVGLIPRGVINHDEDKPSCIQSDTRFVADWLKSKCMHKLCSVFEGIQEPFICKSVVY